MKKFIVFIGIVCIMSGLKLMSGGLNIIKSDGDVFYDFGNGYTRLDTKGDYADALKGISEMGAKVIFEERLENESMTLIYAFSPYINEYEILKDKKINIMAAVRDDNTIVYGKLLIMGSY